MKSEKDNKKRCPRCGTMISDSDDKCNVCGYDFILSPQHKIVAEENKSTDAIDYPVLTFIFAVTGMLLPFFLFSILALFFAKKPSRTSLLPFKKVGLVIAYLGLVASLLVAGVIISYLLG